MTILKEDTEETTCYLVTPSYKKSVYEDIMYTKMYGDTRVSLKVTKIWRYGEFEVDLTISESKEIIKLNEVNLNEYCTCAASTDNLVEYDAEVLNIDKYDKQLQKQINLDVFEDVDNEYPYDDSELVDEHGWEIDDTLYSIVGGVELDKEDKDDDEDDESEDDESEDDESEEEEDDEGDGARFGDIINNYEDEKVEEKEEEQILTGSAQQCKYVKTDLVYLCINMDCDQYPPDWDFKKDTEETYQGDPWLKCNQCDGYYNNDAMGDILYVQEEPNNQEAECSLCGKTKDIVQMKGSGQYLCGNACDESEEEEDDEGDGARFGDIINNDEAEGKIKCETCAININTDDIIELSIEVNGHKLKLCLCENCFQDKADILRKEGWNVDDFVEEEEEAAASEEEEAEEEVFGMDNEQVEDLIKKEASEAVEKYNEEDKKCTVYYSEYRCKHCDCSTSTDDPDCYICGKMFCMMLVQIPCIEPDNDDCETEYEYEDEDEDDNIKEEPSKKTPLPTFSPLTEEQLK